MIEDTTPTEVKPTATTTSASDTALLPKVETKTTEKPRTRTGPLLVLSALKDEYRDFIVMALKHLCGTHADAEGWLALVEEDIEHLKVAVAAGNKDLQLVNELSQNIATYCLALATGATLLQDELTTASKQVIKEVPNSDIVYVAGARHRVTNPNVKFVGDRVLYAKDGPNHEISYTVADAIKEGLLVPASFVNGAEPPATTPKPVASGPLAPRSLFSHAGKWYRYIATNTVFNFKSGLLEHKDDKGAIHAYALSVALGLNLVEIHTEALTEKQFEHLGARYECIGSGVSFDNGFVHERRGTSQLTRSVADALRTNMIKRI